MIIFRNAFLIAIACLAVASTAKAKSDYDKSIEAAAMQTATCAAYFDVTHDGLEKSNADETTLAWYDFNANQMLRFSIAYATINGRANEMAIKVTEARFHNEVGQMLEAIGHRYENIAILIEKYGRLCVELAKAGQAK